MTHHEDKDQPTQHAFFGPLLFGLLLAITMHAFQELSQATALPIIVRDLGGASLYGAAFSAYLLGALLSLVWAGFEIDRKGPFSPFLIGLAIFASGIVLAGLAWSMPSFIAARALQGIGGGTVSAVTFATVTRAYPEDIRPRVMAWMTTAWVVPSLIAPAVAGYIAEYYNWRWIFWGILPFMAVTAIFASPGLRAIPVGIPHGNGFDKTKDALRIAFGMGLLIWAIGIKPSFLSGIYIVSGLIIALMPLKRILPTATAERRLRLWTAIMLRFAIVFAFFGAESFMPLMLIELHNYDAFIAGLILTGATITWVTSAFAFSKWKDRFQVRVWISIGMSIVILALVMTIAVIQSLVPAWTALIAWTIGGLGMGATYTAVSVTAMANTDKGREGATGTAIGMAESLGVALIAGFGGAILNFGTRAHWLMPTTMSLIWVVCIAMAAIAIATVIIVFTEQNEPKTKG